MCVLYARDDGMRGRHLAYTGVMAFTKLSTGGDIALGNS